MLTGLLPPSHGVRDNGADQLGAEIETVAEVLQNSGYQTAAFIGAEPLKKDRGLAQGFEIYDDSGSRDRAQNRFLPATDRLAEDVAASAAAWIRSRDKERPIFAFIHFFDPHWPYEKTMPGENQPGYDGEIAYVDQVIGHLLKVVSDHRNAENRLLVITSDHGEGLGEHGEKTHCIFVYDSTLRIPLIVHGPKWFDPKRIAENVGLIDVAPTLLDIADRDGLADADGDSLVETIRSGQAEQRDLYFESLYPNTRFGWSALRGMRRGSLKYIHAPRPELYDVAADPGELKNIYDEIQRDCGRTAGSIG